MISKTDILTLANQYELPERQLSEAQEVLLFHGVEKSKIRSAMETLCQSTKEHGGGALNFDKLLKGQIAILKASLGNR